MARNALTMSESYSFVDDSSNRTHHENHNYHNLTDERLCLVCGYHVTPDQCNPLVKVEPVEDVGSQEGVVGGDPWGVGDDGSRLKSSNDEQQLFHWFSKWFSLQLKGVQWDFQDEPFPFCTVCKNELIFLFDVKRKIGELEETLKNGLEELKKKVDASEGELQLSGMYQRDSRYSKLRGQVSGNSIWLCSAFKDISALLPFVRISNEDKVTAEKRLIINRQTQAPRILKTTHGTERPRSHSKNIHKATKNKSKTPICKPEVQESEPEVKLLEETRLRRSGRSKKEFDCSSLVDNIQFGSDDESSDSSKISGRSKTDEDEDYVPPEADLQTHQGDIEDMEVSTSVHKTSPRIVKGAKPKIDPDTGILTCLKVQFKPLKNDLYSCTKCSETVKRNPPNQPNTFREHVLRLHSTRHACPKCSYSALNIARLKSHINRAHKGDRVLHVGYNVCDICGKNQSNSKALHSHRWNIHYTEEDKVAALARGETAPPPTKIIRTQCEDCGELIPRNRMAAHKLSKHGSEEEQEKAKVLCTVCGKQFFQFSLLKHMSGAHPEVKGIPSHTCGECGRVFKLKSTYKQHLKVHRGLQFKCGLCGKGFRTNTSYTGHMNLHNNVRPYPCGRCPLAFASEKMMRKHFRHYHAEGSKPKRAPFLRGLEIRNRVDMSSIKKAE